MRVAARRCTRVGARSGSPVEDYGVVANILYYLTKPDVVGNNADLIAAAAKVLAGLPKQTLGLTPVQAAAPYQQVTVNCTNIDRLDLFLNDRPVVTLDVTASTFVVTLPTPGATGDLLIADGYRKGDLVVSTRLKFT
jgi:hypothetical protein